MTTGSDVYLGLFAIVAAGLVVAAVMREPLMILAVFLALAGQLLVVKSWLKPKGKK